MAAERLLATQVGPLTVIDGGPGEVVEAFRGLCASAPSEPAERVTAEAHVAALLHLDNEPFVRAFNASKLRYADGNAIVLLARLSGAKHIRRAVTTDVAWDFLRVMAVERRRRIRVGLVGGPPGLARGATQVLSRKAEVEVVGAVSGFQSDWAPVVAGMASLDPDLVYVGMGTPVETLWAQKYAAALPTALLVPCGGWFGYLVGQEKRAPAALRRAGLEWAYRIAQDPGRLRHRYLLGAIKVAQLAPSQVARRR